MKKGTKITIESLRQRKRSGEKTAMLTCYDFTTARLMAEAGVDAILVGDTFGEVCLGFETTLPVELDVLLAVTAGVRRGARDAFLLGDMPFLSYQASLSEAVHNAGRFMTEAGCDCVKVEVDRRLADVVHALSRASIPVMAHLGLRPQSVRQLGGYRGQGSTADSAQLIVEDAKLMEASGASALLLEAVPAEVAQMVTDGTDLPVIGCAAGPYCDGQVVVMHDMLGYESGHPPRSVKRYANMREILLQSFGSYAEEVRSSAFPDRSQCRTMSADELNRLRSKMAVLCEES
jgi:3-methyl-2-oxobutanoate hydroxymethyltransferase